jgi:hypothetical protein
VQVVGAISAREILGACELSDDFGVAAPDLLHGLKRRPEFDTTVPIAPVEIVAAHRF